jgi:hypothetical protein
MMPKAFWCVFLAGAGEGESNPQGTMYRRILRARLGFLQAIDSAKNHSPTKVLNTLSCCLVRDSARLALTSSLPPLNNVVES